MQNLTPKELEEKFELFLFNMDDYLEDLMSNSKSLGYNLDLSLTSLNDLEQYIIVKNIQVDSDDYIDISAYLGEVARINYRGQWICNLDKEKNSIYYGFPVIIGLCKVEDVLFSPFHLVKSFILRRKENLFLSSIISLVEPEDINWDKFPTED